MASARGATRVGVRPSARTTPVVEEIVPASGWTEDSAGHYLLVDLPEFRKEEVKLQVDSNGHIIVKGERQASEQKRVHFQLTFPVPVDSDTEKLAGKFDSGILYVTIPKQITQENKESETEKAENSHVNERAEENHESHVNERAEENHDSHETNADNEGRDHTQHASHTEQEEIRNENENEHTREFSEQAIRKWEQEPILRSAVEVLKNNKGIVITAVIAFSLGLYVSRKFQFSAAAP